jgi:hypothetical protein
VGFAEGFAAVGGFPSDLKFRVLTQTKRNSAANHGMIFSKEQADGFWFEVFTLAAKVRLFTPAAGIPARKRDIIRPRTLFPPGGGGV